jgi:hypothetical protein
MRIMLAHTHTSRATARPHHAGVEITYLHSGQEGDMDTAVFNVHQLRTLHKERKKDRDSGEQLVANSPKPAAA